MIVCVGGIKGGSGKTTLAVNLAVLRASSGKDVLLIDADEQGNASDFSALRDQQRAEGREDVVAYTCVQLRDGAVREQALKLKRKYDDIVIDCGGRDTAAQRAALSVADLLVVPFLPRSFDLWTLDKVRELADLMQTANRKLKVLSVLNRADARGRDNEEALALLAERLKVADVTVGNRKAFASAAAFGLGVGEWRPVDEAAFEEIRALYSRIYF